MFIVLWFLVRKAAFFLALYVFASLAIFASIQAVPGDPVALRFGKVLDPERVAVERERLGLDRPWYERYAISQKNFLSGDWGRSLSSGRLTTDDVSLHLPATLELSLCAMFLGGSVGLFLALFASVGNRAWLNEVASGLGSIGLVAPIFWIGIVLLLVGSHWLGWFPMGGRFNFAMSAPERWSGLMLVDTLLAGDWAAFGEAARHLVLPSVCLAFFPAASITSVAYARLREPELAALTVALRSRGYNRGRILWRHLLRVAAPPTLTVAGTSFGALLGGAFLTETVFSWPGIGRYLVSAILARDIFVAQNVLTFLVLLVIGVAFVSDLAVWKLEPRRSEADD